MRLVFTKDIGDNFKAGVIKDYPKSVWVSIAKSAKLNLSQFTKAVDDFANQYESKAK